MKVVCGVYDKGSPHGVVLVDLRGMRFDRDDEGNPARLPNWWKFPANVRHWRRDSPPDSNVYICERHGPVVVHPADERGGVLIAHRKDAACLTQSLYSE